MYAGYDKQHMLNMFMSVPAPILAVLKEACHALETLTSAKVYTLLYYILYCLTIKALTSANVYRQRPECACVGMRECVAHCSGE